MSPHCCTIIASLSHEKGVASMVGFTCLNLPVAQFRSTYFSQ